MVETSVGDRLGFGARGWPKILNRLIPPSDISGVQAHSRTREDAEPDMGENLVMWDETLNVEPMLPVRSQWFL